MNIDRRGFNKLCLSVLPFLTAGVPRFASGKAVSRRYHRVKLVDSSNNPIHTADLRVGKSYIFHYPYITTPCFLINLGKSMTEYSKLATEDGRKYEWRGGVGPNNNVVAYSAICAHMMTHPAKAVSFINYRHDAVNFKNLKKAQTQQSQVIYCCSEKSVYDAANGARVLGGPARQPLAVILLEFDSQQDAYYVVGTRGGEMFDKFFDEFGYRLALEYKTNDIRFEVRQQASVLSLEEYCENQVLC